MLVSVGGCGDCERCVWVGWCPCVFGAAWRGLKGGRKEAGGRGQSLPSGCGAGAVHPTPHSACSYPVMFHMRSSPTQPPQGSLHHASALTRPVLTDGTLPALAHKYCFPVGLLSLLPGYFSALPTSSDSTSSPCPCYTTSAAFYPLCHPQVAAHCTG